MAYLEERMETRRLIRARPIDWEIGRGPYSLRSFRARSQKSISVSDQAKIRECEEEREENEKSKQYKERKREGRREKLDAEKVIFIL